MEQLREQRDIALVEIVNALRIATLSAGGHRMQDIQRQLDLSDKEMKVARARLKTAGEQIREAGLDA